VDIRAQSGDHVAWILTTRGWQGVTRRRGFIANLAAAQREIERNRAAQIRAQAAAVREAQRARAAYERAVRVDERERKRLYQESRAADVAADNSDIETRMSVLTGLLAATLTKDDYIELETLKEQPRLPRWQHQHLEVAEPAPVMEQFMPPSPSGMAKIFGGRKKYAAAVANAQAAFAAATAEHAQREAQRMAALNQARAAFDEATNKARQEAADQNEAIDAFRAEFAAGDPDAVVSYFDMVLQASSYPNDFPRTFKLAFVPNSLQVVVEYELPSVDVIPAVKGHRYVKASDSVTETARPKSQIMSTYISVLAQITLRTLHEIFEADRGQLIDVIVFNGMLSSIDRSTGQPVRPCVISVRAVRDTFTALDLANVDPIACLKHLSASVSRSPAELVPVRPILEFSMVDPRFVADTDVLSGLDQRPNLMELTPSEFESLIQNLFTKMGLDTKQTRPSRDGGVDCVAYDTRAVLGGKVVIQAKRYKNTVGVSAVRDLFGTVMNEGASKGILVTTSGYGKSAFEFANDKPLELLDGANLLALLAEHANIEAKIIPPDDWRDPVADAPDSD
jgi:restriction system protein